jgi:hypothetical protein
MLLTANELDEFFGHMALSGLYLIIGAIAYATYFPPHYPLFMDTMTGKYGIPEVKRGMLESLLFFSRNTLLTILMVLIVFLIMNITTPFRVWSMNRKMDKIISLLEKIAKK